MSHFPRTIRSLNANKSSPWLVALIFGLVVLVAWAIWFFFAQMTFVEVSQSAQVVSSNIVVANFEPDALQRIKRGQLANLYLYDGVGQPNIISARVTDINPEEGQVEFIAQIETLTQADLTGKIEVEVEHISPARFVLRASGFSTGS